MACFVAFAVLAVMGIFSSTHRVLAREALACIGRRVTFRPCDTGFREKIQGRLVGFLMRRSVLVARLVNKHFEILAWIFFLITVWSLFVSVDGAYNFYRYGSCNGLNDSSFCVLDPSGANTSVSGIDVPDGVMAPTCEGGEGVEAGLLSHIPLESVESYPQTTSDSSEEILFIGCFECPNTRKVFPEIDRLKEEYDPNIIFIHHPTKPTTSYMTGIVQCTYEASEGDEWWSLMRTFFASDIEDLHEPEYVYDLVEEAGYDSNSIAECAASERIEDLVSAQRQEVINTGIYGTPLIFVNEEPVVGPKPYRVYKFLIDEGWWQ